MGTLFYFKTWYYGTSTKFSMMVSSTTALSLGDNAYSIAMITSLLLTRRHHHQYGL